MNKPINTFKTLEDVFGVSETPVEELMPVLSSETPNLPATAATPVEDFPALSELQDDYQKARQAMRDLIDKGNHVVDNMLAIATQTESARSFEVAGNLIKTMSEVAKDLVALHKQTNDARKRSDDRPATGAGVVNNTQNNNIVFQGSTTDLLNAMGKR